MLESFKPFYSHKVYDGDSKSAKAKAADADHKKSDDAEDEQAGVEQEGDNDKGRSRKIRRGSRGHELMLAESVDDDNVADIATDSDRRRSSQSDNASATASSAHPTPDKPTRRRHARRDDGDAATNGFEMVE